MISVNQLEYTYPKQAEPAVQKISFEIKQGEIFGFLGPSGAGKSTTQRVLIKLLKAFRGQVRVMDKPLQEWSTDYYNHELYSS